MKPRRPREARNAQQSRCTGRNLHKQTSIGTEQCASTTQAHDRSTRASTTAAKEALSLPHGQLGTLFRGSFSAYSADQTNLSISVCISNLQHARAHTHTHTHTRTKAVAFACITWGLCVPLRARDDLVPRYLFRRPPVQNERGPSAELR